MLGGSSTNFFVKKAQRLLKDWARYEAFSPEYTYRYFFRIPRNDPRLEDLRPEELLFEAYMLETVELLKQGKKIERPDLDELTKIEKTITGETVYVDLESIQEAFAESQDDDLGAIVKRAVEKKLEGMKELASE